MTHDVLTVNQQGRVVIPVGLRRELGIGPGSQLVASVDDGRLVLEGRARLLARIQAEVARRIPPGVSLAEDLHAERQAESAQEEAAGGDARSRA